jgi:hypothetical protein
MKRQKKPRVSSVGLYTYQSPSTIYFFTIPYDKKSRIILSSVECAYNGEYFSIEEILDMPRAL